MLGVPTRPCVRPLQTMVGRAQLTGSPSCSQSLSADELEALKQEVVAEVVNKVAGEVRDDAAGPGLPWAPYPSPGAA